MSKLLTSVLFILLFGCLICNGKIIVPTSMKDLIHARENVPQLLVCRTDMSWPNSTVSWYYQPDVTKITKIDPGFYIVGDKDESRCGTNVEAVSNNMQSWCLMPGTTYLWLNNTERSDSGIFTCIQTNLNNPNLKSYGGYELSVRYVSKPNIESNPLRIVEGGKYTLQCESKGDPTPKFSWYFNGKKIDRFEESELKRLNVAINSTSGTLTIDTFSGNNVGSYKCKAFNQFIHTESEATYLDFSFFSNGVIAGLVLGSIAFVAIMMFGIYYLKEMRAYKRGNDDIAEDIV